MRFEIFSPDLQSRHELSNATSVQFEEKYNDVGKMTIVLPMDDYNIAISQKEAIVYIVDLRLAYEVAEVQSDTENNEITLNGYALSNRLNRRIVATAATVQNVEHDLYEVVRQNLRGLPVLLHAEQGLSASVDDTTLYGEELISAIQPVLNDAGYGHRAVFDYRDKTITWEIYQGEDHSSGLKRVVFSEERGSAPGLLIDQDASTYKNVCYCKAQYKDQTEFVVTAGTVTGNDRRELWAEYSGDPQGEDESNEAFQTRVRQYAALQLGNYIDRLSFTVNADTSELGTAYRVGDLVSCVSLRHGVQFNARVTGATYSQDANNGMQVSLTLGDPILTIIGGIKLGRN